MDAPRSSGGWIRKIERPDGERSGERIRHPPLLRRQGNPYSATIHSSSAKSPSAPPVMSRTFTVRITCSPKLLPEELALLPFDLVFSGVMRSSPFGRLRGSEFEPGHPPPQLGSQGVTPGMPSR